MLVVRDRDGKVINKSRNLAGIRRYVGGRVRPSIKVIDVSEIAAGEGKLCILFENGCSFETNFASYSVLKAFVNCWRNVHGSPLSVNGQPAGVVSATIPPDSTPTTRESPSRGWHLSPDLPDTKVNIATS
jgi:hypothetical protein